MLYYRMKLNKKTNKIMTSEGCRCSCYLDAPLTRSLDLMEVAVGAAWTGAGALPQEVEGAAVTRSCRTGAAQTNKQTIHKDLLCFLNKRSFSMKSQILNECFKLLSAAIKV